MLAGGQPDGTQQRVKNWKKLQGLAQVDWWDFQGLAIFCDGAARHDHPLFSQHVRNFAIGKWALGVFGS
jgi:hypothetical protein